MDLYKSLLPLIEQKTVLKSPKQFHYAINKTFHDVKTLFYDNIHQEIWQQLLRNTFYTPLTKMEMWNYALSTERIFTSYGNLSCSAGLKLL